VWVDIFLSNDLCRKLSVILTLPKKARSREIDDCSKERLNKNNFWQRTTTTKESSFFYEKKGSKVQLLKLRKLDKKRMFGFLKHVKEQRASNLT
jgi:hypothetical protein